MMTTCDSVAERIALGETLGELTEHAASCERCQGMIDLPFWSTLMLEFDAP